MFGSKHIKELRKKYPLVLGEQHPSLRQICERVETIDDEVLELVEALGELTREYDGVGLSAPQIGHAKRIISVTKRKNGKRGTKCTGQTIMINPEVIKKSDALFSSHEGCLSLPNVFGDTMRHETVVVHYMGPDGKNYEQKLKGFNAAIVQHEIDHLDGVLFIDKLV